MENSIRAIYIGAGMLIAVMVIGVFIYMFQTGAMMSESYERKKNTEQLQAFNAQFEIYENITSQYGASKGFAFETKGNTASDVISCANLVFNINEKNDYNLSDYITLTIKAGGKEYYVYPVNVQEKNNFVTNLSFNKVKDMQRLGQEISDTNYYSFYDFLKEYNNVRIVDIETASYKSSSEAMHEYYFDVDENGITYSASTGKVDSITFVLTKTKEFNNTTYWIDNI